MSKALKARLARLEQRTSRRQVPRITFHVYGRDEADLIGYRLGKATLMRAHGESLAELQARAWELGAGTALGALYRPENGPCADVAERWPAAPPPSEPNADEFAIGQPGIGSIASRADLIRCGAIRVPPERLIN